jgi:hypothetical protein
MCLNPSDIGDDMLTFYIKEWPDGTATLMTAQGHTLWTFHDVDAAKLACRDWYKLHESHVGNMTELRYATMLEAS